MWCRGGNIVSVNDFLREMCLCGDEKGSLTPFVAKFCRLVHNHAAPHNFWYIAEAADKTKHIIMDIDNIVNTFFDSEFKHFLKFYDSFFDPVFSNKQFTILQEFRFLSAKKLKKELKGAETFSDFIKAGPVFLNAFNIAKPSLERLLSLDVEVYEMDQKSILEIGLVEYTIKSSLAEVHHIVITDNEHLSNGKHVPDNRNMFNFGSSKRMSFDAASKFVQNILSKPATCLIGHNVLSDVKFLRDYNLKFNNMPYSDTQNIFKYHSRTMYNSSLTKILTHLSISNINLHNAANDAYYTLLAFVKMANLNQHIFLLHRV